MEKKYKVGIVIATYNGAAYILDELESILLQTIQPDEVIISDDNSTDNTCELIKAFIKNKNLNNWKLIENNVNQGFSVNFMNALYKSTADYIFLADQDDLWDIEKIECFMNEIYNNSGITSIASEFTFINSYGEKIEAPKKVPNTKCVLNGELKEINAIENIISSYIRGCTMIVRKDVVTYIRDHNLERFCSNYLLGHDWLLWMISSLLGEVFILCKPLIKYRVHNANTSLAALRRDTLIGDVGSRVDGLKKSIKIHEFISEHKEDFPKETTSFYKLCVKAIDFEKTRLSFLCSNTFKFNTYFKLTLHPLLYRRYYRDFYRGFKVLFGDLLYQKKAGHSNYK